MNSVKKAVCVLFIFFIEAMSISLSRASEPNIVLGRPRRRLKISTTK